MAENNVKWAAIPIRTHLIKIKTYCSCSSIHHPLPNPRHNYKAESPAEFPKVEFLSSQ